MTDFAHVTGVIVTLAISATALACPAAADSPSAVNAVYPGVGIAVVTSDEKSLCTAGFVARNERGAPVMFTAGHCDTGGRAEVNSVPAGGLVPAADFVVTKYEGTEGEQTDIAVMSLTGALQLNPNVDRQIPVTGYASTVVPGMWLCKIGATTGRSCGRVMEASATKVKFHADIAPGDSGGPVFGYKDDGTAFAVGITIRESSTDGNPVAELIGPWLERWGLTID